MSREDILIALPAYNEAKYLPFILRDVLSYGRTIVVIDDGSVDGTDGIIEKFKDVNVIRHNSNLGYGRSIVDAFKYAQERDFKWIITMDSDLQHSSGELDLFIEAIKQDRYNVISGSRYTNWPDEVPENVPEDRFVINRRITEILNNKIGLGITDAFCGFKAYRVDFVKGIELTEYGYAFPLQFWIRAAKANIKIKEVAVEAIYLDSERSFGDGMDCPCSRFECYKKIINTELIAYEHNKAVRT